MLLFHNIGLLSNLLVGYKTKTLVAMKHFTGTRIGFLSQKPFKPWDLLAQLLDIKQDSKTFSPYMYYEYPTSIFVPI